MIKIICVGKIKEKALSQLVDEYLKRLSKYTKIEIKEVADESSNNDGKLLLREQEKIQQYIGKEDYVIALDIEGESLSSPVLANKINQLFIDGKTPITFIIGGSYGFSDIIKKRANYCLSFSKLTFPHQLFRVMLLEQLYRAFKIMKNETYHK